MKWLVMVIVLCGGPHAVYGADQSEKRPYREIMKELGIKRPGEKQSISLSTTGNQLNIEGIDRLFVFKFHVAPLRHMKHVTAQLRLYVRREIPLEELKTSMCFLEIYKKRGPIEHKRTFTRDLRDQFIAGDGGTDIWLPVLKPSELVTIHVLWDKETPLPDFTTIAVNTEGEREVDNWINKESNDVFQDYAPSEWPLYYHVLSLDDVCRTYSIQDILPVPDNVIEPFLVDN